MQEPVHWIDRDEALARLGIKSQTLYAYVSRRRIAARPDPNNLRRSLYAAGDIARLTGLDPTDIPGVLLSPEGLNGRTFSIASHLTTVIGGRLFYRGRDATQWAQASTLEETACLLWDAREGDLFHEIEPRRDTQPGLTSRARLFAALARRAQEDPGSNGRTHQDRLHFAASALNEAIDAVSGLGPRLRFHQRLCRGWKVAEREQHLLRRALVLVADHPMDSAILATRVTSSSHASPAAAAMAGLVTLPHSPVAVQIEHASAYLQLARRNPAGAASQRLQALGAVPGFGDPAWPHGDPRAQDLIAHANLPADLTAIVEAGKQISGHPPSLALALALVAKKLDLQQDGAINLYLIGRLVGLLGHALDQALNGSPITARVRYVGPQPGAN